MRTFASAFAYLLFRHSFRGVFNPHSPILENQTAVAAETFIKATILYGVAPFAHSCNSKSEKHHILGPRKHIEWTNDKSQLPQDTPVIFVFATRPPLAFLSKFRIETSSGIFKIKSDSTTESRNSRWINAHILDSRCRQRETGRFYHLFSTCLPVFARRNMKRRLGGATKNGISPFRARGIPRLS